MKNTLENKERFISHYYGQKVLRSDFDNFEYTYLVNFTDLKFTNILKSAFLELTPLSQITDEDSIEVAKLINKSKVFTEKDERIAIEHKNDLINCLMGKDDYSFDDVSFDVIIQIIDNLRRKEYALPFMDITVEEQIEFGWIKLKTK